MARRPVGDRRARQSKPGSSTLLAFNHHLTRRAGAYPWSGRWLDSQQNLRLLWSLKGCIVFEAGGNRSVSRMLIPSIPSDDSSGSISLPQLTSRRFLVALGEHRQFGPQIDKG